MQQAEIAQLVEHNLAKVRVASSSLVFRSKVKTKRFNRKVEPLSLFMDAIFPDKKQILYLADNKRSITFATFFDNIGLNKTV